MYYCGAAYHFIILTCLNHSLTHGEVTETGIGRGTEDKREREKGEYDSRELVRQPEGETDGELRAVVGTCVIQDMLRRE